MLQNIELFFQKFYFNFMKIYGKIHFLKYLKIYLIFILYMNEYKNQISILRNILQKSNDKHLIDYVFKKVLPNIFDFYMENYINPNIMYNIDNSYKKYYADLYNELSKSYKMTTQDALVFRKKYERVNYIIKLLKDENIYVKDYKKEAIKIY